MIGCPFDVASGNDLPWDGHGGDGTGVLPGNEKQFGVENDHQEDDGHNHHHEQPEIGMRLLAYGGVSHKDGGYNHDGDGM